MILFRTSNQKRRASQKFLTSPGQQVAVSAQLEKKQWIDEIFSYITPIPRLYESRFGPAGFSKIPFYASKKKETTFFEFGWGLLKRKSILNLGISAVCYEIRYAGTKPVDAANQSNIAQIRDPQDYSAAHAWLQTLNPVPEAIRYPAVRDPGGGGVNFAIYEKSAIVSTLTTPEEYLVTPVSDSVLEVQSLTTGQISSISPIK